jgi:hypothetical protein
MQLPLLLHTGFLHGLVVVHWLQLSPPVPQ